MTGLPELKKCPFCGSQGYGFKDKYSKYFTGCKKCNFYYGIRIQDGELLTDGWTAIHNTPEAAIEAWNKRTAETEARAEAIGEFTERMKWEYENSIGIPKREIDFARAIIDQVAKRLMGGNDHEQNYQGNT